MGSAPPHHGPRGWRWHHSVWAWVALLGATVTTAAAEPRLSFPVHCEPGATCFVQHYLDIDPSSAARDYTCGNATYNGHNGIDIRLLSAAAASHGVDVLAAADGRVLRRRDGVRDAFARETAKAGQTDRACGNGLVVAHDGGLETQYCHLRLGSVVVAPGQSVRRGQPLGKVGYSGQADFAHLHFTVRRGKRIVDPFTGRDFPAGAAGAPAPDSTLCDLAAATAPGSLWDTAAAPGLAYKSAEIIQSGFAAAIPDWAGLEHDHQAYAPPAKRGADLVVFARAINLGADDRLRFRLKGPNGFKMEHTSEPPGRKKAIFVAGAGQRARPADWAGGVYEADISILRGGREIAQARAAFVMP